MRPLTDGGLLGDKYYIPELGRYVDNKGRRIKKKKSKKSGRHMTVIKAISCAVKISSGLYCTHAEQKAALATLGWAFEKGYITGRSLGKRVKRS